LNTAKKTLNWAHKTWLAGVGACDSGREKATNKFDQLFVDGSGLVNKLLEKGELVETQLQAKIEARKMLKDKISALRAKLSFGNKSRDHQIDNLSQRVDNLIDVVAKLAQQKAAENKATSVVSVKNTSAKTAAKPVAKVSAIKSPTKSAATKPAATKPAAAKPAATKTAETKPAAAKAAAAKLAVAKTAATKPAVAKTAATKTAATKTAVAKQAATKTAVAKQAAISPNNPKADDND
jgi:hypothetical protein